MYEQQYKFIEHVYDGIGRYTYSESHTIHIVYYNGF